MFNKVAFIALLLFGISFAQVEIPAEYLGEALQNNLALKQKEFSLDKSMAALDEARGMFLPRIDLFARYSRAGGGREIDIPIGDLVNPMQSALNLLLQSQVFPADLPNEKIMFLREREHDTKLRLTQPLFQPKIFYNYSLNKKLTQIEKAAKNKYVRELIADVKTAYIIFLQAGEAVDIYQNYMKLLVENKRVNQSLVKNGKATPDVVYRADAEIADMEKKISTAETTKKSARYYFNFLLNKDLNSEIKIPLEEMNSEKIENVDFYIQSALKNREEIFQLNTAVDAMESKADIYRSDYLPNLNLAVDYGFQGEEYKFNSESDYWMASLVLNWNIFNGFSDEAKVSQAIFSKKESEARLMEVEKLITLEVRKTIDETESAQKTLSSARKNKLASEQSFKMIDKKYREGMTGYIEYLDAFNQVSVSDIELLIEKYNVKKSFIKLEKVSARVELEKFIKNNED